MYTINGFEFKALRTRAGVGLVKAAEMMCLSLKQLRKAEREDLQISVSNPSNKFIGELIVKAIGQLGTEMNL